MLTEEEAGLRLMRDALNKLLTSMIYFWDMQIPEPTREWLTIQARIEGTEKFLVELQEKKESVLARIMDDLDEPEAKKQIARIWLESFYSICIDHIRGFLRAVYETQEVYLKSFQTGVLTDV